MQADIVIAVTISMKSTCCAARWPSGWARNSPSGRIRDPEYMKSLSFLKKELWIDYAINPERNTALEISRILRYPFSGGVETFARGQVEMMDFRLGPEDGLIGIRLRTWKSGGPTCRACSLLWWSVTMRC